MVNIRNKIALLKLTLLLLAMPGSAFGYTILIWGDSLSSAYNIPPQDGWVSLLEHRVQNQFIKVVNASIPGETSHGGAIRVDSELKLHKPDLVVLALGSNDGLQGLETEQLSKNLSHMIAAIQGSGAKILLLGMKIPPNYGKAFSQQFEDVYSKLAVEFKLEFVPFFLEPVALDFDLIQADGLHPTAEAQPLLLDHIWPSLQPLLPTP